MAFHRQLCPLLLFVPCYLLLLSEGGISQATDCSYLPAVSPSQQNKQINLWLRHSPTSTYGMVACAMKGYRCSGNKGKCRVK